MLLEVTMLSLEEVAYRLGVSVQTVRRLIENGELKGVRVGRQWRVRQEDLDDYVRRMSSR
jgi:excisionase family DNA binding protein